MWMNRTLGKVMMLASARRGWHQASEAANETKRLEGKAALVTDASSGLGRAMAIALARAGADVALVARSQEELESAKEEVSGLGRRVRPPGGA